MTALVQKSFIMFILLTCFVGRIAVYALPAQKLLLETLKKSDREKSEKSESTDTEDKLDEKVKLNDLINVHYNDLDFATDTSQRLIIFSGEFNLTSRHLQTLEYPPK